MLLCLEVAVMDVLRSATYVRYFHLAVSRLLLGVTWVEQLPLSCYGPAR
jgi:hypothetical protein